MSDKMNTSRLQLLQDRRDVLVTEIDKIDERMRAFTEFLEGRQINVGERLVPTKTFVRYLLDNTAASVQTIGMWASCRHLTVDVIDEEGITVSSPTGGAGMHLPWGVIDDMRQEWLLQNGA